MKIYTKYAKNIANKKNKSKKNSNKEKHSTQLPSQAQKRNIFSTIDENFGFLHSILGDGLGLVEGKYDVLEGQAQVGVAYIEGITDIKLISSQVIEPLLKGKIDAKIGFDGILLLMQSKFISIPNTKRTDQMEQVVDSLLNGNTVLFIDHLDTALIIGSRKVEKRAIEKPENEVTVFASKDSFIEDLETNCSMIIRRLPTPDLHIETFTVGVLSHTKVKLLWFEGTANTNAVEEARRRIKSIDIDTVYGIGALAELIEDAPWSVFPKYRQSQRPDIIAKSLIDGQFAILCSNSPFALAAPISFWDHFKTMDDYVERSLVSSFLRMARFIAFILSIQIAPVYLAFVAYNHSIVPPPLALNIANGREGVPFPSVVELFILTFAITLIREASMRVSGSVGFFIGVLSAIVIGTAAVDAGYVSASVIIVAAIAAISSFAISTTTLIYPARLINYFLILLAGAFGLFGVINGTVIIFWHLAALESFGVPYLYPFVPFDLEGMKDTFIRAPYSVLKKRCKKLIRC